MMDSLIDFKYFDNQKALRYSNAPNYCEIVKSALLEAYKQKGECVFKNGIMPIMDDFDNKERKRSWNWRGDLADNWRLVIAGVGVGAMSIVDELSQEERPYAERAMEQAAEFGHSLKREIAFLTVHSMLHLLGYDHVTSEEDEKVMFGKQEEILELLGITREV